MRLSTTLIFSVLSLLRLTSALHPHALRHKHSSPPDAISLRQHHTRRPLLDICAYIDLNLGSDISILGISLGDLLDIQLCLCLSALPLYLELTTNVDLLAAVDILGEDQLADIIRDLINNSDAKQECSYPDHSKPICSAEDVCGFHCDAPYVRNGRDCICEFPYTECNGKCGNFPHGCPSPVPRSLAGLERPHMSISERETTDACKPAQQVCGVYGSQDGWEYLDVSSNSESCGGCVVPHPFSPKTEQKCGIDCTALAGVRDVACECGDCVVRHCKNGWSVSFDRKRCIDTVLDANALQLYSAHVNKRMKRTRNTLPLAFDPQTS